MTTSRKKSKKASKKSQGASRSRSRKLTNSSRPDRLTLRSYQVGFGDCFLLTFHYGMQRRHVLIDFGSTAKPKGAPKDLMMMVAEDIRRHCENKIHVLVATHRHQDHIGGFATSSDPVKEGTGDVIRSCNPNVVIMPWTEDPKAETDAKHATTVEGKGLALARKTLRDMEMVAASVTEEEKHLRFGYNLSGHLAFLGEDNLKNISAVKNLIAMGEAGRALFVRYEDEPLDIESELPGVTVRVLGPPDLTQSEDITSMRSKDAAQFWMLQAAAGSTGKAGKANGNEKYVFESAGAFRSAVPTAPHLAPPQTRWLIRRMNAIRGTQLLQLVRVLDNVMNNTSVILLIEVGGRKLLFPGDAQIENWEYALSKSNVVEMLKDVDVYKVGHHGSRNANPLDIWRGFKKKRSNKSSDGVLQTFMSTMAGKHPGGHNPKDPHTEVPRESLVEALKKESEHFSTQMLAPGVVVQEFEIQLDSPRVDRGRTVSH